MIDSPNPDDPQMDPTKRNQNTGVTGGLQTMPGTMVNSAAPPAVPGAPGSSYDRATAPGLWQATGNNVAAQDALLKQWGMAPLSDNGTGTLPSGEQIDMRRGARSGDNTAQWMGVGGGASSMAGGGGMGAPGGVGGAAGGGGYADQVRALLLQRLQAGQSPVDQNDPEIADPYNAANLAAQRGLTDERKQMAEQLFAQGGGTVDQGQLSQGIQQSGERNAVGMAGLKGQLMQRAYDAKRQQLMQSYQLAASMGDAQEARSMQMAIAQMDNAFRQQQLSQQGSQWNDQYGLNKAMYEQNQNNAALGGMA